MNYKQEKYIDTDTSNHNILLCLEYYIINILFSGQCWLHDFNTCEKRL